MKKYLLSLLIALTALWLDAQTLEKMNWFNESEKWSIDNNTLTVGEMPGWRLITP